MFARAPGRLQPDRHAVDCLSDDDVLAFVGHRLTGAALASTERHVAGCPTCRRLVAAALRSAKDEPHPQRLGPGARVGRFEIVELVGVGASGVVYRARDPQLSRDVALKLLRPDIADPALAQRWRERFLFEAQAMARLSHPHVVVVYEAGVVPDSGESFIAMEMVQGRSLAGWLGEGPHELRPVIDLFLQVGRGLGAAHAAGLVHGDLKPENVLVGRDGRARITDFGLARPEAAVTPAGTLMGTPLYMAPEILRGAPADARSDQFAFCVALYMALYGRHPFSDPKGAPRAPSAAVVSAEVARPAPYHGVPPEIFAVLARGLRADPAERHASMEALADELVSAVRRARVRVLRRRGLLALGGALIGVAIGAGLWRAVEGPRCGNGRIEPGEECDDGNRWGGDGCVACRFPRCGDGQVRAGIEECDDGNQRDGDGCSAACVACVARPCRLPAWRQRPGSSHAYRLVEEPLGWDQARARCAQMGAHLAVLDGEAAHAFVAGWAHGGVWIGAHDREREGELHWVTGAPVVFSRFAPGEPDDATGQSDCVSLDSDQVWHDRPCWSRYAALCEVE
jgi:cysteine-rich repeat protein